MHSGMPSVCVSIIHTYTQTHTHSAKDQHFLRKALNDSTGQLNNETSTLEHN